MNHFTKPSFSIKCDDFSLLWFGSNNQFLILDGLIESYFDEGHSSIDFNKSFNAMLNVDNDSKRVIENFNEFQTTRNDDLFIASKTTNNKKNLFISSILKLDKKLIKTLFINKKFEQFFNAPYEHLKHKNEDSNHEIVVNCNKASLNLHFDQNYIYSSTFENYFELQAQFCNKITEVYHNYFPSNWLCSFHACAVHKNNKTYLLLGDSGAGKSTLTTLMSCNGYRFIADDLVLMDENLKIYDNPAAISLKQSSWEIVSKYYHKFKKFKISKKTKSNKKMKFLPFHTIQNNTPSSFKIDALIWVNFNKNINTQLFPLDKKDTLVRLIPDTWVNPNRESAMTFAKWAVKIKAFQLNYFDFRNVDKLIEAKI